MESLLLETGIDAKDLLTVSAIVDQNPGACMQKLQGICTRVFGKNIKPSHYLVLGYLVGYIIATEQAHENFYKYNSLCQRQN